MATKSTKNSPNTAETYNADKMQELTGLDPIRQSPAQYVGSVAAVSAVNGRKGATEGETLTAGGFHLFVEILANSSDEATNFDEKGKPHADFIEIILHEDQSITVTDNGRGVPPDINKATGKSGLELTYLTMNAGGKFKDKKNTAKISYKSSAGLHGMGSCCTAALSDRLDVTVWRNGKEYTLTAKAGIPGTFDGDSPRAKFTPSGAQKGSVVKEAKDTRPAARKKQFPTGTSVHWHPDPTIWGGTDIPWKDIHDAVLAQSYMAPTCVYRIIDETKLGGGSAKKPVITDYHHPGGIYEMIEEKTSKTTNLSPIVNFDVPAKYLKKVTDEDENGNMIITDVEFGMDVKIAMRWTSDAETDIEGYANSVHCAGQHVDGFRRGMSRGVGNWIKNSGVMTKKDEKDKISPDINDITEGLVAVVEVILEDQCDFESQTKERLDNAEVLSCVSDVVKDQIEQWLGTKKNAASAKRVAKSILDNARLRTKQKKERESAKKIKEKLGGMGSKPAKLCDCRNEGPGTELIICEGDSASGNIKITRDANWQAVFPIRGVSMNAYGAKDEKILSNREFADLTSAMRGGGIGKNFDLEARRYERLALYTDADEDGNFIRALLLVFIYLQFPGMIENGYVFAGMPPLYSIKFLKGDRRGEFVYAADEEARDKFVADFVKKGGDLKHLEISRSKGLGAMSEEEFKSCLDPKTRQIRTITLADVADAADIAHDALQLLFSSKKEDVARRRVWIDETFESETD